MPHNQRDRDINLLRKRRHDAMYRSGAAELFQHAKGKLSARERVEHFLDPGTFHEIDVFAEAQNLAINTTVVRLREMEL